MLLIVIFTGELGAQNVTFPQLTYGRWKSKTLIFCHLPIFLPLKLQVHGHFSKCHGSHLIHNFFSSLEYLFPVEQKEGEKSRTIKIKMFEVAMIHYFPVTTVA